MMAKIHEYVLGNSVALKFENCYKNYSQGKYPAYTTMTDKVSPYQTSIPPSC